MHHHLSHKDRVAIETLLRAGHSQSAIAAQLRVHRSTVSREIKAKSLCAGYFAGYAHKETKQKRHQAKYGTRVIEQSPLMQEIIRTQLVKLHRSPEQIAHALGITHQTVYAWLYRQGENLNVYLPRGGRKRRPYGKAKEFARGWTKNVRSITERPKIIEKRLRVGDWEGDTVVGADRTRLLVHIDRKSRFVVADLIASGNADIVATRVVQRFRRLPTFTITYDRGSEFALWKHVQEAIGVRIFFAQPHHPWERGTCENTNGLIRRFVPKRSALSDLTRQRVAKIAWNLNHRPRKCLNWKTPCEVFGHCCREINNRTDATRFEGLWERPACPATIQRLATPVAAASGCCVSS